MTSLNQFGLLLWKNYLLQRRKILVTVLEIGLPMLFALILIFIRQRVEAVNVKQPTRWNSFSVDKDSGSWSSWTLYYSPNSSNLINQIMEKTRERLPDDINNIDGFPNETTMVESFLKVTEIGSSNVLAAVSFIKESTINDDLNFEYKLRFPSTLRDEDDSKIRINLFKTNTKWNTQFMFPMFQKVGPRQNDSNTGGPPDYMKQHFLPLQYAIDMSITDIMSRRVATSGIGNNNISVKMQRISYPPYIDDNFVLVIQQQFPLIIMLSFVFSSMQIVKDLVYEKEQKLKESMKMMGLNGWLHWLAWFVKYLIFLIITVSIETIFFCINTGSNGRVIGFTSPSVLFVFLLLYGVATISFCFAISTFFSKANSAAAIGGLVFFISYIPYFFLQSRYDTMSKSAKIASCLISNVAMAFGAQVIGMFEGTGAGVQWNNITRGASIDDHFTLLEVMIMLIIDAVWYAIIAWYTEAIFPGDFGIPQPWYFPFQKSYWCGMKQMMNVEETMIFNDDDDERRPLLSSSNTNTILSTQTSEFFEKDPQGLVPGIKVLGLRKEFKNGSDFKVAVNDMTLNMYEGQITALLGHNGAGKTTTMSILTGLCPPTHGTAFVNGYDICQDIGSVRKSLGICPQHNVLFESLTVEEHLIFFTKLKGYPKHLVEEEVENMLTSVDLMNKRDSLVSTLSGGMKRKLSVGIALTGGSQVIILDEPSSGMDPNARRHMWDILQRHRNGRTILLSTHFMDEADALGDRVAIMADGVLQCCGTPLFLKNKYGAGYRLVIVKFPNCDIDRITNVIQNFFPDVRMESNVGSELSYVLPFESKANFDKLFELLDENKDAFRISSYGASVTTMEEVFLKVGGSIDMRSEDNLTASNMDSTSISSGVQNTNTNGTISSSGDSIHDLITFDQNSRKEKGFSLFQRQFRAMFLKRVLHTFRNIALTISQLLVPLLFTIISLIVLKTMPTFNDSPPLVLDLSKFESAVVAYGIGNASNNTHQLAASYSKVFNSIPSVSMVNVSNLPKYANLSDAVDEYLIDIGRQDLSKYNKNYLVALDFPQSTSVGNLDVIAYFSNQPYHSSAISLNAITNAIFKFKTGNSSSKIVTINHPMPKTANDTVNDIVPMVFDGFAIAFNALFGMSFLASSFVLFLINEQSSKSKHSQIVSGVNIFVFWSSTFIWDFINFIIPCIGIVLSFIAFGIDAYVGDGRWAAILLLFILYAWAVLPFMYLFSFIFTVPSSGLIWLTIFNIANGIATIMAVAILSIPQLQTQNIADVLEWLFLILLPNYCLGQGLEDFYSNYQFLAICDELKPFCFLKPDIPCCKGTCTPTCFDFNDNYLGMEPNGIGRMLLFLGCQGLFYFAFLFLLEFDLHRTIYYFIQSKFSRHLNAEQEFNQSQEDNDVNEERKRITETPLHLLASSETIILKDLTKVYGDFTAVDRLNVGIHQGECFGLLGINGAGKTSTFQMMTGDAIISSGIAYLFGYDIKNDFNKVQNEIGYCPQFDALIDQLTGYETLSMYGHLRGLNSHSTAASATWLIDALLLRPYANKLVKSYSGGTKRKLSTAVALIGGPQVIFLDEPSSGMDPIAKRHLWNTLSKVRDAGRTLVLTSHSMEECEALCTKIAIMVNGQFKCLGSTQHLKSKFGEGYTVIVKVAKDSGTPNVQPIQTFILDTFPGTILKDVHEGLLHFHVTDTSVKLGHLFGTIESIRARFAIEDYSVSQTTLEQVFINFARTQHAPRETQPGCCTNCYTGLKNICCKTTCHRRSIELTTSAE